MRPAINDIPTLRFPEFNGSWKRWLLDEFATRGSGHTPSKSYPEYYGGEIGWVSLADSNRLDQGYIEKTKSQITDLGLKNSSAVLHPAGTVILSRDAGIGKSAVLRHPMAVSQHFIVWRPIHGTSVEWFLYYWLQIMKPEFERIAIGSTIKTIGLPYFKKLEIRAPSAPEQRKIADFLTAVDERIAQLSQKKALLDAYKKGVMQQLFTHALRFKDDHGNDFPDWEKKELGGIGRIIRGSSPRPQGDSRYYGGHIPRLMVQDVTRDGKWVTPCIDSLTEAGAKLSRPCAAGTLTIVCSGTVGVVSFLAIDACIHDGFLALVDIDESIVTKDFLFHRLNTLRDQFERGATHGGVFTNLTTSGIKEFSFQCPSLPEQTKIANFLTALDRKIEAVAAQIAHTQTWKKGLLQQMFV